MGGIKKHMGVHFTSSGKHIGEYDDFGKSNQCVKCNGEASYTYKFLKHWMAGDIGEAMIRKCNDCGYEWAEKLN